MRALRAWATAAALLVLSTAVPAAAQAAPSCAEGPQTEGQTIVGTPCDDTIRAPRGVTTVFGEGGSDVLYGQRGNDTLFGADGNDRLYGGVGDDHLRGGPGDDRLSGGFGADSLDGEGGNDFDRGDATIDFIGDSGGGTDTLSFATGVTPGFPNAGNFGYAGFPSGEQGRGVFLEMTENFANDGTAPNGGGLDRPFPDADPSTEEETFEDFETVVGTPFSDLIVGTTSAETIYGGGGADVILGKGGGDRVFGGARGDYCETTGATTVSCEHGGGDKVVDQGNAGAIAVGRMTPNGSGLPALYATGGNGGDRIVVRYAAGAVVFLLNEGSQGSFDSGAAIEGECDPTAPDRVVCAVAEAPDSIVLAGVGGDDRLSASPFSGLPAGASPILLGGDGDDVLSGGSTEDALVDGPGDDSASAGSGDDAVPNNQGRDNLDAGAGEDLFISNGVCEGDVLSGGSERDNANWANFDTPIAIDMGANAAGLVGGSGRPDCAGAPATTLREIEDVEGTNEDDTLVGDSGPNQLLGRLGADSYFAGAGDDSILANSGTPEDDPDPTIDCGEGFDTAQIDFPENGPDAAPVGCESIYERAPNSFRPPDTPTGAGGETALPATSPAPTPRPPQVRDRIAPRTRITRRPRARLFSARRSRAVSFAFASSEAGSTFRCRLDRSRFRPCRSPRRYRLEPGRHVIRVYAVDAAGNRDRSPATFRLRVIRVSAHSSRSHRRLGQTR